MPVITFDKGAIFTLAEETFRVGQSQDDFEHMVSLSAAESLSTYRRNKYTEALHRRRTWDFIPYHLSATFTRPCLYIALTFKSIRNILSALQLTNTTGQLP